MIILIEPAFWMSDLKNVVFCYSSNLKLQKL